MKHIRIWKSYIKAAVHHDNDDYVIVEFSEQIDGKTAMKIKGSKDDVLSRVSSKKGEYFDVRQTSEGYEFVEKPKSEPKTNQWENGYGY